jgi:hypothetical protein
MTEVRNEWYDGKCAEATKVQRRCLPTNVAKTQNNNIS